MSTFNMEIGVGNSDQSRFEKVEALVDTGATYTQLPGSVLRSLGVIPFGSMDFILADGQSITRDIGESPLRIDNMVRTSPVIFADEGSHALLGAVTLEIFGLGVDPVNERLIAIGGLLVGILRGEDGEVTQSLAGPRRM
ncbi:MAG: aspartyl protease family protein [Dehalococcoidia bacterium]|nr:aspartyl protease family protein [Dehalococcoidia bacterium]